MSASIERLTTVVSAGRTRVTAAVIATLLLFGVLFAQPMRLLASDWWNDPEAGHGLLLAPLALWLAWRAGIRDDAAPQPRLGLSIVAGAVLLRYLSGLAAELFTMRASMIVAAAGLVVFYWGARQLRHWWLPCILLLLSVPLPSIVTSSLALPLQFKASRMGAALLAMRHVPVRLSGNVILLPGHRLFVTEACSGLRSLTALLSLGVLLGGMSLRLPLTRVLLIALAIPVAIAINGVRVFLTGFLVYFVSPEFGEGFMHLTEGWVLFIVSFGILGGFTWLLGRGERLLPWRAPTHA